ncbi:Testis-expressed protein 2 [Araneus ventricosus]|uniref:Testis-expressed protein 2 n=1 Tax=Araneus ventricosus TaxID=182803 RepID=A0A4Y2F2B3_ARAVE|nr:Testis-expressed protein 2 [Araneus ventricosus]
MATYIHSNQSSEEICLTFTKESKLEEFLHVPTDTAEISDIVALHEKETPKTVVADVISEKLTTESNSNPGDPTFTKNVNVREVHETSPFKQAVKGFVLNKLSKKVGSSHLLSGLTEKIVKKLEEGKENTSNGTPALSGEKNRAKESSIEVANDPIPCELKSVVANDISEISTVEEAIECFEESKTLLNIPEDDKKLNVKPKILSRSLPSSPARYFGRKGSTEMDHSSDSEEKSSLSESNNISIFPSLDLETTNLNSENGIELSTTSVEHSEEKFIYPPDPKPVEYFKNAYVGESDGSKNLFSVHKYQPTFLALKNLLAQLPLPHGFLLLSIIVHNSKTISSYYLDYIFDGFIVAYVTYTLLCIVIQIPSEKLPPHVTYDNTQLEMTSIHQSVAEKTMKGSVKILRGDYDPDEQRHHVAELVNIYIENQCLKISRISKHNESDENITTPFEIYDLCGADISLVPKGLSKRRAFRKKFPICIKLPVSSKNSRTINDSYDDVDQEERCDYVTLFPYKDGLLEAPKRQALYIFALTDREKETWFYALKKCINLEELNATEYSSLYSSSPKLDMTSISYSSLMEINSEETLSVTEDSSGISAEISFVPSKIKPTLEFDDYLKTLFENYFRDINTSEHSWKPEIFSDASQKKGINSTTRPVEWINVALGRLFYDFLTQKYWSERIIEKIQKKLNNLEMPSFVETLEVTDVFMGTCIPQLHSVSNVVVDEFGIWLDFDFTYNGSFQMTLQTKLKMPKKHQMQSDEQTDNSEMKQSAEANESSDDEGKSPKQNKLINKLEKWIAHKHFQTVAQSRFVKKYVGDISNMLLTLTVEVNLLQGILAVNIPPVPTDRVWYGFRKDPILNITASPKVGSHEINLSAVVKMIEQRLIRAFKKAIVMPHMDDLIIPLMFSSAYDE